MEVKDARGVVQLIERRLQLGLNVLRFYWDLIASGQAVCHFILDPEWEGTYTVPQPPVTFDQDNQHGVDRAPVNSGQED